jgi:hypothetical protein
MNQHMHARAAAAAVALAFAAMTAGMAHAANSVAMLPGDNSTATVSEVRGKCFVRDTADAVPRAIRQNDTLSATQQIACDQGASLKIRYAATGAERTVTPIWMTVGNAIVVPGSDNEQRGGRQARMIPYGSGTTGTASGSSATRDASTSGSSSTKSGTATGK